eukprot:scaffold2886_cov398-Prasinococcus_capsulatus_cf.AAC.12
MALIVKKVGFVVGKRMEIYMSRGSTHSSKQPRTPNTNTATNSCIHRSAKLLGEHPSFSSCRAVPWLHRSGLLACSLSPFRGFRSEHNHKYLPHPPRPVETISMFLHDPTRGRACS